MAHLVKLFFKNQSGKVIVSDGCCYSWLDDRLFGFCFFLSQGFTFVSYLTGL